MNVAAQLLESRPDEAGVDHAPLARAIDALNDVALAATTCADACLVEGGDLDQRRECIQVCADAADVASAAARVLCRSGPTVEGTRALVEATAKLLSEASPICAEHGAHDKYARLCADSMSGAEQALARLQAAVAAASTGS
jgi:hypothetical protein